MKATVTIAKLGEQVEFDSESLPAVSNEYAWTYGLTQSINDSHASVARKNFDSDNAFEEAVREKAYKRIEQVRSGDVPGSRAPASPTKKMLSTVLAKLGTDFDATKIDTDKLVAYLERQAASGRAA